MQDILMIAMEGSHMRLAMPHNVLQRVRTLLSLRLENSSLRLAEWMMVGRSEAAKTWEASVACKRLKVMGCVPRDSFLR